MPCLCFCFCICICASFCICSCVCLLNSYMYYQSEARSQFANLAVITLRLPPSASFPHLVNRTPLPSSSVDPLTVTERISNLGDAPAWTSIWPAPTAFINHLRLVGWPLKRPAGPIWIPKIEAVWAGGIYLVRQEGAQCILRLEQCILAMSLEQRTGLPLWPVLNMGTIWASLDNKYLVFFLWTENDTIVYEVRCEQDMNKTAPSASLSSGSGRVFV